VRLEEMILNTVFIVNTGCFNILHTLLLHNNQMLHLFERVMFSMVC